VKQCVMVTATALFLSACATPDVRQYAPFDRKELTIQVPAVSGFFTAGVKDSLRRHGWTLLVPAGQTQTIGTASDKVSTTTGESPARYMLAAAGEAYNDCIFPTEPRIFANVAIVDRKTNTEVWSIRFQGCQSTAIQRFDQEISKAMPVR